MIYKGSTPELILKLLLYKTLPYKEVERMIREQEKFKSKSSASIRNTLTRLRKKKLVTKTNAGWSSSHLAKTVLNKAVKFSKNSYKPSKSKINREMIVMYDIPEHLRSKRDLLREGLRVLNFKQKQQSVWIGPAPLPKEFIEFINELNILKYINFFQVREKDIV